VLPRPSTGVKLGGSQLVSPLETEPSGGWSPGVTAKRPPSFGVFQLYAALFAVRVAPSWTSNALLRPPGPGHSSDHGSPVSLNAGSFRRELEPPIEFLFHLSTVRPGGRTCLL